MWFTVAELSGDVIRSAHTGIPIMIMPAYRAPLIRIYYVYTGQRNGTVENDGRWRIQQQQQNDTLNVHDPCKLQTHFDKWITKQ